MAARPTFDPLAPFHPAVRAWFGAAFEAPTRPQALGWPVIARGDSTLILAPTGSGKTLAAFLWCLDRLMFTPAPPKAARCRVLHVSQLKALAVDVERNLRALVATSSLERGIDMGAIDRVVQIEAPRRPARAAVAAARTVGRSAGGRLAVRILSGAARNVSRVPARFLRHAGARRDARRRPEPEGPGGDS